LPRTTKAIDKNFFLYDSLQLSTYGLSKAAFEFALTGYNSLIENGKIQKDNILTIIDFSLPSNTKRLFVIDLVSGQLLFNTFVSHGRGSGTVLATRFSNAFNSFKSSLGFYTLRVLIMVSMGILYVLKGKKRALTIML